MADVFRINKGSPFILDEAKDYNESLYDYKIKDSIHYNRIPSRLKKTFCVSIFFLILGLALLTIGILKAFDSPSLQDSFVYWISGVLCIIPGGYYLAQFIRAKSEQDEDIRREIFDDIPNF
jgi:hypothetical protein